MTPCVQLTSQYILSLLSLSDSFTLTLIILHSLILAMHHSILYQLIAQLFSTDSLPLCTYGTDCVDRFF